MRTTSRSRRITILVAALGVATLLGARGAPSTQAVMTDGESPLGRLAAVERQLPTATITPTPTATAFPNDVQRITAGLPSDGFSGAPCANAANATCQLNADDPPGGVSGTARVSGSGMAVSVTVQAGLVPGAVANVFFPTTFGIENIDCPSAPAGGPGKLQRDGHSRADSGQHSARVRRQRPGRDGPSRRAGRGDGHASAQRHGDGRIDRDAPVPSATTAPTSAPGPDEPSPADGPTPADRRAAICRGRPAGQAAAPPDAALPADAPPARCSARRRVSDGYSARGRGPTGRGARGRPACGCRVSGRHPARRSTGGAGGAA